MKEDIRWIADIYETSFIEAFFLYLYFKWKRRKQKDIISATDTIDFDSL